MQRIYIERFQATENSKSKPVVHYFTNHTD